MSEMGMGMMGSGSASGADRARRAAEAAVASPLLEDINLSGACGILVNVTAGLDMTIGEFEEVGNIIKEFASENATVVVGTVIDPDMQGELRVTVVATGLGGREEVAEKPIKLVYQQGGQSAASTSNAEHVAVQATLAGFSEPDYGKLDRPTVMRNQQVVAGRHARAVNLDANLDYLDIPAFLRRQAD